MLSADPVLRDFFISEKHADLAGPWRPGSIRDQSVRACLTIDRAIRRQWISEERPLAIVGAGIAGVTAAILARRHRIPVTVIDHRKPLSVLSESFRWVDPTAYDWPHAWWSEGRWAPGGFPEVRIEAGEARTIAVQFADLLQQDPEIQCIRTKIEHLQELIDRQDYGLVLDCRGAAQRATAADPTRDLPFGTAAIRQQPPALSGWSSTGRWRS